MTKNYEELIKGWEGSLIDLCYELYSSLCSVSEQEKISLFEFLCEYLDDIDIEFADEMKVFDEDEKEFYKSLYGKYIDEAINIARVKADCGLCDFYKCLWDIVYKEGVLSTDKEKSFALYWILIDKRIPYIKTEEPTDITDEEIDKIMDERKSVIDKLYYIFSLSFEKRTDRASLLLKELLNVEDFKTQVVLLVKILDISDKNQNRKVRRLLNYYRERAERE